VKTCRPPVTDVTNSALSEVEQKLGKGSSYLGVKPAILVTTSPVYMEDYATVLISLT
jgi:hypothetical protein